jgi:hypothetical protein
MAEQLFKRGQYWHYRFTDANGVRRTRRGCRDKRTTQLLLGKAELEADGLWGKSPREMAAHFALKTINSFLESRPAPAGSREASPEEARSMPHELAPWEKHLVLLDDPPSCVYFLIRDGAVVYVGQTTDLHFRVTRHRRDKRFDRVFYLPVPSEDLNQIEMEFIRVFCPEYNLQGKGE